MMICSSGGTESSDAAVATQGVPQSLFQNGDARDLFLMELHHFVFVDVGVHQRSRVHHQVEFDVNTAP